MSGHDRRSDRPGHRHPASPAAPAPVAGGSEPVSVEELLAERGRTLAALRQSEERWRRIVETALDAYIGIDEDGAVVDWNHQAERLFGWSRGEVVGRRLADLVIPPDLREVHRKGLERFIETGEGPILFRRLELPGLDRDGRPLDLEVSIWPSRHGDDWRFNAFLRDIGEQKRVRAYVQLVRHVAVAANSLADLRGIVCAALREVCGLTGWPVGHAYLVDADDPEHLVPSGFWHLADPAFDHFREVTELTDLRSGEGLPGRVLAQREPVWVVDITADDNYPRIHRATEVGARSAVGFPVRVGDEIVAVMEFLSTGVVEPAPGLLEVMDDVGNQLGRAFERDRAARQLERTNEELRAANELKDRFLSTASHELRSPLSAILGFASLMDEWWETTPDAEKRDHVRSIERQSRRLIRLVGNLLTVSRIEAGAIEPEPETVLVRRTVDEVVADLAVDDVAVAAPPGLAVTCDRDHLVQILVNLLGNADRYGRPPIVVSAAEVDRAVAIRVRDHGPGVPDEEVPRLFDRFHTTGGRAVGTGLGLSIVHGLVGANRGTVRYEHAEPGAAFVVQLPRSDAGTGVPPDPTEVYP